MDDGDGRWRMDDGRWRWLLAMADGDAPLNASTSQRINLCLLTLDI
ncbi:MAG: hypothetical protein IKK62_01030 [Bacteroidaceae bacterium]|nr:hypothetical protein [Bacteroidaceae bacterium]